METPILDRLEPMPHREAAFQPRAMLIVLCGGIVLGMLVFNDETAPRLSTWLFGEVRSMLPERPSALDILWFFVTVVAALFAAIAIHESGHAIVGTIAGFRVHSIRIGRLLIDWPFRISLYRGTGTGAGGWVTLLPVKRDKLVLRAAAMVAGGPVFNLISVGIVRLLPFPATPAVSVFVTISVVMAILNLVPYRNRAVLSDGRRLLMLLGNRARGERWLAMMKLMADLADGIPFEALSPEYIALLTAITDRSSDTVSAHAVAYSSAFHQHDDRRAGQMLETALKYSGYAAPIQREALMAEATVFQARRRKRADLAEAWLQSMPAATEMPWLRAWAEAALLEVRGAPEKALSKLEEAAGAIRAGANKVQRDISLRSLEKWRADLRAASGTEAVAGPSS